MLTQTVIRLMTKEEKEQAIADRKQWILNCSALMYDLATGAKVKEYQIGSRRLTRYDINVNTLERLINDYSDEIAELTGQPYRYMGRFLPVDR